MTWSSERQLAHKIAKKKKNYMELNVEENQLKLTKYLYLKSKCVHVPYEKKNWIQEKL